MLLDWSFYVLIFRSRHITLEDHGAIWGWFWLGRANSDGSKLANFDDVDFRAQGKLCTEQATFSIHYLSQHQMVSERPSMTHSSSSLCAANWFLYTFSLFQLKLLYHLLSLQPSSPWLVLVSVLSNTTATTRRFASTCIDCTSAVMARSRNSFWYHCWHSSLFNE